MTVRELRITKCHKSKFRESRQTYERGKTEGQKEKPDEAKERSEEKKELSVAGSSGALSLAKFMVSLEAPITWEPLDMLGEKLSEEGTSHSATKKLNLALQPSSIPVAHSTETHKHGICI